MAQSLAPNLPRPHQTHPKAQPEALEYQEKLTADDEDKHHVSLGERFKNLLPKNRPERGGTIRKKGFWEQLESANATKLLLPRHATGSRQSQKSRQSARGGSDRIINWNTAKDLSEAISHLRHSPDRSQQSADKGASKNDRRWSWVPRDDLDLSPSRKTASYQSTYVYRDGKSADKASRGPRLNQTTLAPDHQPPTIGLKSLEAKEKARKLRRSLKESGDYLGVQGINPETGVPDVVTPSDSEQSALSLETEQELNRLIELARSAPSQVAKKEAEREISKIQLKKEVERLHQKELAKQQLAATVSSRWRRRTHQWSSAQAPDLSPIAQSQRSISTASSESLPFPFLLFPSDMVSNPGRQSHPIAATTGQGGLIHLSIPDDIPAENATLGIGSSPEESSLATTTSSATVVRTPHRLSLANATPAARELHENGINFDILKQLEDEGSDKQTGIKPPRQARRMVSSEGGYGAYLGCEPGTKRLPSLRVAVPDIAPRTHSEDKDKKKDAFLGQGFTMQEESNGKQSYAEIQARPPVKKSSKISHNFTLASLKNKTKFRSSNSKELLKDGELDLRTSLRRSKSLSTSPESSAHFSLQENQSQLIVDTINNQITAVSSG